MERELVEKLKNVVRESLGLHKELEEDMGSKGKLKKIDRRRLMIDRKFGNYNHSFGISGFLEILRGIDLDIKFKYYIEENKLTEKGKELLRKAGDYAANESPNALDLNPNLYKLASLENLDELAKKATTLDIIYLKEYLDEYEPNNL
ncbi:MAG: hypothetical protein AABX77_00550 [Nanoarchaeota archaeon]